MVPGLCATNGFAWPNGGADGPPTPHAGPGTGGRPSDPHIGPGGGPDIGPGVDPHAGPPQDAPAVRGAVVADGGPTIPGLP
ncbi:hypothetical protein GS4_05_00310 [Gordonia soli NBRC 108243]|uniref:Uncharacterized protein n=1 Tax=Gordonia soli NBRC 108243 TaxID=1223545 RepID=M0QE06_9ACTN|nr:hypothetical protein GS4_05_00310 [Gordonia soli NBRC 108243]